MENIKKLLGARIRELRKEKHLTQEQLAESINIEIPSLSNIENGKNYPNSETIEKIAHGLGKEVFELYIFEHLVELDNNVLLDEIVKNLKDDVGLLRKIYRIVISLKNQSNSLANNTAPIMPE